MSHTLEIASIPEELKLDNSWSIGEKTFSFLVEEFRSLAVENLLEFGSGVSSTRLALELPQVRLLSIENNPTCYRHTVQLLDRYVPGHSVKVELRELCWQRHGFGFYQSYRPGPFFPRVDALIIDGPPGWTRRGREVCLYQAFRSLRIGGRVYLDDYVRTEEQQIVRNWEATYPDVFRIRVLDFPHSPLCVLEKTTDLPHARFAFSVAWDNWKDNVVRKAGRLRNLVGYQTRGAAGSKCKTER
jgi:hypothetical protein